MSKINDGGPAFSCPEDESNMRNKGMSLRDYFAAKAMQGMVSAEFAGNVTTDYWAEEAYKVADAMLKARQE